MNPEQISPEWLTAVLRQKGTLPRGKVTRVTYGAAQQTFASNVWRLDVAYSIDAPRSAPKALFLKSTDPALTPGEFDPKRLEQEIVFYAKISPGMPEGIAAACYAVDYEPETGASFVLLKDATETHIPCPVPPGVINYEEAVDALASLHAFWWDHPRLGKDVGIYPTQAERAQEWAETEQRTAGFILALGAQLPAAWRAVYQSVLPALPNLFQRHATGRNLTLVHGDAHLGNFLFPKDAENQPAVLIDWQFWHPTIAGTDLAFLLATESSTETRRQLEGALLRRYHRRLLALGVHNYTWVDCWNDYRLSVVLVSIFIPVWRWSLFHWEVDLPALERGMAAFEDLQCAEILDFKYT